MASTTVLTYGPSNIDAFLTTCKSVLDKMAKSGELADNVFNHIPLLNWLKRKSRTTYQGGATILTPLLFGKNSTFSSYSGAGLLDTTQQEGLTLASWPFRNYGGTIVLEGPELRANAGAGKGLDYVKAKTSQALMSAKDKLDIDMFASTQASTAISTLPVLVDATSTVADINSTTNSWWQAQAIASGSFAGRGLADLRDGRDRILQRGQAGGSAADIIITTASVKQFIEAAALPGVRYENEASANLGLEGLKFSSAMVEFDANCASGELYMLPSSNLQLAIDSGADFSVGDFVEPSGQDARIAKVLVRLNLTTNNRRRLVKLTGITA